MMERRYTVREIDALRHACNNKFIWGSYSAHTISSQSISFSYNLKEKNRAVEDQVRTYMLAGLTAEDLYASERPAPE